MPHHTTCSLAPAVAAGQTSHHHTGWKASTVARKQPPGVHVPFFQPMNAENYRGVFAVLLNRLTHETATYLARITTVTKERLLTQTARV